MQRKRLDNRDKKQSNRHGDTDLDYQSRKPIKQTEQLRLLKQGGSLWNKKKISWSGNRASQHVRHIENPLVRNRISKIEI